MAVDFSAGRYQVPGIDTIPIPGSRIVVSSTETYRSILSTVHYSSGQKKVPVPFRYCKRTTQINVRVS